MIDVAWGLASERDTTPFATRAWQPAVFLCGGECETNCTTWSSVHEQAYRRPRPQQRPSGQHNMPAVRMGPFALCCELCFRPPGIPVERRPLTRAVHSALCLSTVLCMTAAAPAQDL